MRRIAVITARGGSKRIPRKNIREFCGRPILAYSIEAALKSGVFDTVMVSTEDREIAETAEKYGAEVPFLRSGRTADDFATTREVLREVLEEYESRGERFDILCCIYPTAPFVTAERLREAVKLLEENEADSVLTVARFSFPPQRCVIIQDGFLQFKWPENAQVRSQDLEPYYHDAGQFYCLNIESFHEQEVLVMQKSVPLILSEMEIQDIDTEEDWTIAELKYRMLHNRSGESGTGTGDVGAER